MEAIKEIQDVLNPKYPFNYASGKTPVTYKCEGCGKSHVRLWRKEGLVTDTKYVFCAECLRLKTENIDEKLNDGLRVDTFVPAVPTEENSFFIGYKHIPVEGMNWWKNLPL